jgi:DNA-binding GntR family transcriptional regulator
MPRQAATSEHAAAKRYPDAGPDGRQYLANTVYEQLRDAIVTLKLAPGASLVETDLCTRLGVSRTPLRAALQRLEQEGFVVESWSGKARRLWVSPLTLTDMRELFLMVGALDGVSARLAAQLEPDKRLPVVDRMVEMNARLGSVSNNLDISDSRLAEDLDLRFHQTYEEAAAGPQLLSELRALHARRRRYVRIYTEALVHAHGLSESLAEHERIIEAIRDGDADAADRAAVFNYQNALSRYARIAAVLGDRGNW